MCRYNGFLVNRDIFCSPREVVGGESFKFKFVDDNYYRLLQ